MKIVNSTYSAQRWGDYGLIQHEVCKIGKHGSDACQSDTVVLTKTGRQIGIVSYGPRCKKNPIELPSVYSSIQDNLQWIRNNMNVN